MKKTILTDIEWYETINVESLIKDNTITSFRNRPPNSCPVVYDPNTRNRIVYHNF